HAIDADDPQYRGKFLDKPWMTIAPDGTLYVTYTVYNGLGSAIALSVSSNHGSSWRHVPLDEPIRENGPQYSEIVTDAAGKLYAVWLGSWNPTTHGSDVMFSMVAGPDATPSAKMTLASGDAFPDDPVVAVSANGQFLYVVYGSVGPAASPDAENL